MDIIENENHTYGKCNIESPDFVDEVTQFYNYKGFLSKFKSLCEAEPEKSWVLCIGNINKLKYINNLYTRKTGNQVLAFLAESLYEYLEKKCLVCRMEAGTIVFAFEFSATKIGNLKTIKYFDATKFGVEIPITMRVGLIKYEGTSNDIDNALNCAEIAMETNKVWAHNSYIFYTDALADTIKLEVEITSKMEHAIKNDEFHVYFQPQFNLDGSLAGAECLCRWILPDGSTISPGLFIPISERNGYIRTLDRLIWEKAFKLIHSWIEEGMEIVPVSINISRVSLETDSLIYVIERLKSQYRIPTEYIHFEVTESAYMYDTEKLISRLERIKELGFSIAMDDFGSGYSSLNVLKDIPIDYLKLDMGFFKKSENSNRGGNIITSVIRMAHDLDLITIAEGVESDSQALFLKAIGCDIIQGYLYGRPMPETDFRLLLNKSSKKIFSIKKTLYGKFDIQKLNDPEATESIMFEKYNGPAAIIEYEKERISLIKCNDKTLSLFGMLEIPFVEVQKRFQNRFKHDRSGVLIDSINQAITLDKEITCVISFLKYKDNSPLWIKTHIWNLSSYGSRYTLYLLFDDITQQKITESTLKIANEQLSTLLNNSLVGMCLMHISFEFNKGFDFTNITVLKLNSQFLQLSGFTEEEVLKWKNKDALKVIHPLDRPAFLLIATKFLNKNEVNHAEHVYRALRKDGSYLWVKIFITGIRQDDGSYIVITNYIDYENEKKKADNAANKKSIFSKMKRK